MGFIAHSATELSPQGHSLEKHLTAVAHQASSFFTHPFLRDAAYLLGAYHDAGKYKAAVQHHIRHQTQERIDHATLGARLIGEKCAKSVYPLLAAPILGHHGGMPDFVGGEGRRRCAEARLNAQPDEQEEEAYYRFEVHMRAESLAPLTGIPPVSTPETHAMETYLAARMLHSALVDADYLNTEKHFRPEQAVLRGTAPALSTLMPAYQSHMKKLEASSKAAISSIRADILRQCISAASAPQGIYSLSVPTGGGKTLASMGFALHHALAHPNIRRVIYAIPFTTITEQNAKVFRDIFGPRAVLEHHSAVEAPEQGRQTDHAIENWDAPIVVTTNVQLFESIFGNRPSQSRKLHNLQNSVIILDEMQALPDSMLKPCLAALDALAHNYGVTVVICTATQPNYDGIWPRRTKVTEIIKDPQELQELLKRTYAIPITTPLEDGELIERLREHEQVLCIVNSREAAQALASSLGDEAQGVYHLSTMMCPKHRMEKLGLIRKILEDKSNPRPCRVISTSLIEAGVDMDFPVVYREAAGLDSIAQAAGRCNRSGDRPLSPVYVFSTQGKRQPAGVIRLARLTLQEIAPRYPEDMLCLQAVSDYFSLRFAAGNDTDAKRVLRRLGDYRETLQFPYESIAEDFSIIQTGSQPVFIPYDETARALITQLRTQGITAGLLRALQLYAASVYPNQVQELKSAGRIEDIDGALVLAVGNEQLSHVYSPSYGLQVRAPAQGYFK